MILYSQDSRLNIYRNNLSVWLDASIQTSYSGSGTSWLDLSGGNRTATLTNGPVYQTTIGGLFNFDGSNDYASGTSLNSWSSQTICIWFKVSTPISLYSRLIEKGANTEWTIVINYDAASYKITLQTLGTFTKLLETSASFNDNLWHHCVVTINSTNFCRIYIDGVLSIEGQSPRGPANKTGTLQIGRFNGGGSYFWKGDIGNVIIYNQELSNSEISYLYNTTKTRFL